MRPGRFGAVLVAAAAAASIFGCGGGQKGATRDEVVCTHEAMTGTHIVEARCYKRSEIDERRRADRAAIERMLINANRPVAKPQGGGPGGPR